MLAAAATTFPAVVEVILFTIPMLGTRVPVPTAILASKRSPNAAVVPAETEAISSEASIMDRRACFSAAVPPTSLN